MQYFGASPSFLSGKSLSGWPGGQHQPDQGDGPEQPEPLVAEAESQVTGQFSGFAIFFLCLIYACTRDRVSSRLPRSLDPFPQQWVQFHTFRFLRYVNLRHGDTWGVANLNGQIDIAKPLVAPTRR